MTRCSRWSTGSAGSTSVEQQTLSAKVMRSASGVPGKFGAITIYEFGAPPLVRHHPSLPINTVSRSGGSTPPSGPMFWKTADKWTVQHPSTPCTTLLTHPHGCCACVTVAVVERGDRCECVVGKRVPGTWSGVLDVFVFCVDVRSSRHTDPGRAPLAGAPSTATE